MKRKFRGVLAGLAALIIVSAAIAAAAGGDRQVLISVFPPVARMHPGESAKYSVAVSSRGFEGTLRLTCQSSAPAVACSVSPSILKINRELAVGATMVAVAADVAQTGSYQLRVTASADVTGIDWKSNTVTLEIH